MPGVNATGASLSDLVAPLRPGRAAGDEGPAAGRPTAAAPAAFAALLAGALAPARASEAGPDAGAATDADEAAEPGAAEGAMPNDTPSATPNASLAPTSTPLAAPALVPTTAPAAVPAPLAAATPEPATAPSAAAESARPAARGTVTRPMRDLGLVAPELRDRVRRVVDRMRDEFGHSVEVVESGRTQARQDHLFAQGRTRPGPVVTWTRSSEHTRGRAVDVTIDGGYTDTAAFRLLQRVAREEGLQTLGMRDPGHLQLPAHVGGLGPAAALLDAALAGDPAGAPAPSDGWRARVESAGTEFVAAPPPAAPAPVASSGGVAAVAPVAPVAAVATVAQVAAVAVPGAAAPTAPTATPDRPRPTTAAPARPRAHARDGEPAAGTASGIVHGADARAATSAASAASADQDAAADDARDPRQDTDQADARGTSRRSAPATSPVAPASDRPAAPPPAAAAPAAAHPTPAPATPSAPATLGAVAAQRVAEVLAAQERGGARQVSHLTLRLENAAGGEDRIRVDLRSGAGASAVGARIDVADIGSADRLAARAGELRDALARHGLSADSVQVSGIGAPAGGPAPAPAHAAAAVDGATAASAGNAGGSGSSSQQQSSGRDAQGSRDQQPDARDAFGRAPLGRDGRGGDARQQGRRARDGWLYDEIAPPRRAR